MRVNIIMPYIDAGKYYKKWAGDELNVNFDDLAEATKCTVSFAVLELCTYLEKIGHNVSVSDSKTDSVNIYVECLLSDSEEFDIIVTDKTVTLKGAGRKGLLYSVYEFLEVQGVRWYSPGFEFVPESDKLVFPESRHYTYNMADGRGFHFEDLMNESVSFILWMARNRLNIHACHAHSKAFQQKLCMTFETGGHIFEKILNPLNIAEDGRYYIDAHRDWYGQCKEEITVENAVSAQFCVSNEQLLDHLADTVINKLNNEWKNEQIFSLDGFDTWGKSCECESCRNLGNGSDKTLKFLSHIRKRLNEAVEMGRLRSDIRLSFCAYEGTDTLAPPENPVPENLIKAGDIALFCPILRCYRHNIDEACERNNIYKQTLEGWVKTGIQVTVCEYYNVSKYEELPLVLTDKICNDIRYYETIGVTGMVYMHVFVKEWGVRTINHYLYANLCRNSRSDTEKLKNEYFTNVYGIYAERAGKIYSLVEKASELIASWRAWFDGSVLTYLTNWDGSVPDKPIECDSHLVNAVTENGYEAVALLKEALRELKEIKSDEYKVITPKMFPVHKSALNPVELYKRESCTRFLDKLNEDIRGIAYGADVFELMTLFADYYTSLYEKRKDSDILFDKIKILGDKMSEYTYSVTFASYEPEFELRDALRRSQLKELYLRCIARRNEL